MTLVKLALPQPAQPAANSPRHRRRGWQQGGGARSFFGHSGLAHVFNDPLPSL